MDRRDFVRACGLAGAAASLPEVVSQAWAQGSAKPRLYGRARLVAVGGEPIKSKQLPVGRNLIFHYPYAGTPCFLLNLGKPTKTSARLATVDNRVYEWSGGTGAGGGVVAYSAICAHRLTYPTRDISFIAYRAERTPGNRHAQVIHCCSEHSQYDPAEGGRVVAGPAPQPLAAILLDYDRSTDELFAVGRCSTTSSPGTSSASRSSMGGAPRPRSRAPASSTRSNGTASSRSNADE
jgi:Rieske Fe-S protein